MQTKTFLTGIAVLGTLALAACGGSIPESSDTTPPPPTTAAPSGFQLPDGGPQTVVVDLTTGGGFVPLEVAVDARPDFRLYLDGTVLARMDDEEFGAFPSVLRYELSAEGIEAVLQAAEDAGLLERAADYGAPAVTDLPTSVLTISLAGASYEHSAYALGFEGDDSITAAQKEARNRYAAFATYLRTLPTAHAELLSAAPAAYEPAAVDVYLWERETDPGVVESAPEWPFTAAPSEWPAPADTAFGGACRTVQGDELAQILALAADGKWSPTWQHGERADGAPRLWSTGVDLVLPGETSCTA